MIYCHFLSGEYKAQRSPMTCLCSQKRQSWGLISGWWGQSQGCSAEKIKNLRHTWLIVGAQKMLDEPLV